MAQIQDVTSTTHPARRAPVSHSDAVQEAKRLEKLQTVSSSHRTSGPIQRPAPAKDGTS